MTHEGRGALTHVGTPTSNFRRRRGGGLGGEDTAQLSPPLAYDFGLDVHGLLFCGHYFACDAADGA
jgi:hypothetical protein